MQLLRVAAVCLAAVLAFFTGCCGTTPPTGTPGPQGSGVSADTARATEKARPVVMTREDFKAAVMGKTPDEVIKAVGKPDFTTEGSTRTMVALSTADK